MKIVLTGASCGFGLAIAKKFVFSGKNTVYGIARREEKLNKIQHSLGKAFVPVVLDVTDSAAVQSKIKDILSDGPVDLLINNAGLALGLELAQNSDLKDWKQMVDTNIMGVLNFTHAILPSLVSRNSGHIINMGSVAAFIPYPGGNVYGATKAFVQQFSLNLRSDLHGTSVRVTDVEPGLCSGTEFSEVRFRGDKTRAEKVYEGVQALTPEDIAETVYWIANLPHHVNVNTISLMPVAQTFAATAIARK